MHSPAHLSFRSWSCLLAKFLKNSPNSTPLRIHIVLKYIFDALTKREVGVEWMPGINAKKYSVHRQKVTRYSIILVGTMQNRSKWLDFYLRSLFLSSFLSLSLPSSARSFSISVFPLAFHPSLHASLPPTRVCVYARVFAPLVFSLSSPLSLYLARRRGKIAPMSDKERERTHVHTHLHIQQHTVCDSVSVDTHIRGDICVMCTRPRARTVTVWLIQVHCTRYVSGTSLNVYPSTIQLRYFPIFRFGTHDVWFRVACQSDLRRGRRDITIFDSIHSTYSFSIFHMALSRKSTIKTFLRMTKIARCAMLKWNAVENAE